MNQYLPIIISAGSAFTVATIFYLNIIAAINSEKKKNQHMLDGVLESIFTLTQDNKLIFANTNLLQILGKPLRDIKMKKVDEVVKIMDKDDKQMLARDYVNKKLVAGVFFVHPNDAEHKYFVNLKSTQIKNTNEIMITMTDVTYEKRLEQSKNDFIYVTSHELRTPLTIIKSYLWMLVKDNTENLSDKQKDYIKKAYTGAERMLELINDTLNIARIEQEKEMIASEDINIKEFLTEAGEEFTVKTKEKDLEFKLEIPDSIQNIYADRKRLREILNNLFTNALKFTRLGYIKIRVRDFGSDFVEISVVDTGKGIDPVDIPKLFKKFSRLDNTYQTVAEAGGTGLGLYIVKSLVETMRGGIGAYSEGLGKGSTFWFILPKKKL